MLVRTTSWASSKRRRLISGVAVLGVRPLQLLAVVQEGRRRADAPLNTGDVMARDVIRELQGGGMPMIFLHVLGNHDLYCFICLFYRVIMRRVHGCFFGLDFE